MRTTTTVDFSRSDKDVSMLFVGDQRASRKFDKCLQNSSMPGAQAVLRGLLLSSTCFSKSNSSPIVRETHEGLMRFFKKTGSANVRSKSLSSSSSSFEDDTVSFDPSPSLMNMMKASSNIFASDERILISEMRHFAEILSRVVKRYTSLSPLPSRCPLPARQLHEILPKCFAHFDARMHCLEFANQERESAEYDSVMLKLLRLLVIFTAHFPSEVGTGSIQHCFEVISLLLPSPLLLVDLLFDLQLKPTIRGSFLLHLLFKSLLTRKFDTSQFTIQRYLRFVYVCRKGIEFFQFRGDSLSGTSLGSLMADVELPSSLLSTVLLLFGNKNSSNSTPSTPACVAKIVGRVTSLKRKQRKFRENILQIALLEELSLSEIDSFAEWYEAVVQQRQKEDQEQGRNHGGNHTPINLEDQQLNVVVGGVEGDEGSDFDELEISDVEFDNEEEEEEEEDVERGTLTFLNEMKDVLVQEKKPPQSRRRPSAKEEPVRKRTRSSVRLASRKTA